MSLESSKKDLPLVAKTARPFLGDILCRKRLFRKLEQSQNRPVIWISAPAGSGKTTLMASFLRNHPAPCLWYQLDAGDGDPASFFHYLRQAARQATPRKRKPLPQLTPEYLRSLPAFADRFFEALYERLGDSAVVVFDNYQDIPSQSPLHALISQGLAVIPEGLTAVLISRSEPPPDMACLQAGGKVYQLGWPDLRLTEAESLGIARLRGKVPGDWNRKMIRRLHEETQGWITGLLLMLGQMDGSGKGQPPVSRNRRVLFDYFAGETLQRVDAEIREFLLKTALLPRLNVEAAERLTGNPSARLILDELSRQNFFTIQHPGAVTSYEYHALFRAFLLSRLQSACSSDELVALRQTAAGLLAQSGQPEAAAALYTEAGDWASLTGLVLENAESLGNQGRLSTLEQWILALPDSARESEPWLLFWQGSCRLPLNPPEARRCYEQAFAGFWERQDSAGLYLAWCGIIDTFIYYWEDFKPLDAWIARLDELRGLYPEYPSPEIEARLVSSAVSALAYRQPQHPRLGDWADKAGDMLNDASLPVSLRLAMVSHLCHYYCWVGDLPKLGVLVPTARLLADATRGNPLALMMARMVEAIEGWMTASWEASERAFQEGLEAVRQSGISLLSMEVFAQGVYLHASAGNLEAAGACLDKMAPFLEFVPRLSGGHYHYLAGWTAFQRGDAGLALEHADLGLRSAISAGTPFPEALNRLGVAQIIFTQGERQQVADHLKQALCIGREMGSHLLEFHALCLKAFFAFESGRQAQGLAALRRALACGKAGGYVNYPWWRADVMAGLAQRALEHGIEPDYTRRLIRTRHLMPEELPVHLDQWPWPVRIFTLGRFSLLCDDQLVRFTGKAQKRPLALLKALIALGGRDVAVERIMDALWPGAEGGTAYQALNMALRRLRQMLGEPQAIDLSEGRLTLDPRFCWVDSWAFERLAGASAASLRAGFQGEDQGGKEKQAVQAVEKALVLYKGPFLEQDLDAAWLLSLRQRLHHKFHRIARTLGQYWESTNHWREASECYEQALDIDDLAEDFYFHLMQCHERLGDRAEAIQVYLRCKEMLATHLALKPSARTETLYRKLRQG